LWQIIHAVGIAGMIGWAATSPEAALVEAVKTTILRVFADMMCND
jgi:hypothetical protein